MRWRLFLEEYSPDIQYIEGKSNVVADALSRLDITHSPMAEEHFNTELQAHYYAFGQDAVKDLSFPLHYATIGQAQKTDKQLIKGLKDGKYHFKSFHRDDVQRKLICHKNKIVIPASLTQRTVEWYHLYLAHPGINRTEETIGQHLWWDKMRQDIRKYVACCSTCQKNKRRYKNMDYSLPKWQRQNLGKGCVWTS